MRIIHPACIGHLETKGSRHAIYSLDFQPEGHRLATAGGGRNFCIARARNEPELYLVLSSVRVFANPSRSQHSVENPTAVLCSA